MIELQVISKILDTKDFSFIENSDEEITAEYFGNYAKEFEFIKNHYKQYSKVPDIETFLSKFSDIELVDVKDNSVYVKLKGHCSGCKNAKLTLKNFVESKLKELVDDELTVVEQ